MPHHIFLDIRRLLMDFVALLDKHSIGNEEREEANRIIEELTVLMKDEKFVEHLETEMETGNFGSGTFKVRIGCKWIDYLSS